MSNARQAWTHFVNPARDQFEYPGCLDLRLITSLEDLEAALSDTSKYLAWDTETEGLDFEKHRIVGFSFAFNAQVGYYVPVMHHAGLSLGKLALDKFYERLQKVERCFVFNMRFDYRIMEYAGYDMSSIPYFDVQVGVHLADPDCKEVGLKSAEKHFLGWSPTAFSDVVGDSYNFAYLDPEDSAVYRYACCDAVGTFALAQLVVSYYKDAKLSGVLDNQCLYPLMKYEESKLDIDAKYLYEYKEQAANRLVFLEQEAHRIVGYNFLLTSPIQLGRALSSLGIYTGKLTKTGKMSVEIKALESLSLQGEGQRLVDCLVEHSKTRKIVGTYLDVLLKDVADRGGFARFHYLTSMVPTGRLAAGKDAKSTYFTPMNVQSVPKPHGCMWYVHGYNAGDACCDGDQIVGPWRFSLTDVSDKQVEGMNPTRNFRRGFLPGEGCYWLSVDFSGQELRVMANLSEEPLWVDTLLNGGDLHKSMAIQMWGEGNYSKDRRKMAKSLNFGMSYGMSAKSISERFGISVSEGRDIYNRFWQAMPLLRRFQEACVREGRRTGTVRNCLGRPRRVKCYIESPDAGTVAFGIRTINNTVIQSVGAELLKKSMIELWRKVYNGKWRGKARFLTTVHDEINSAIALENWDEIALDIVSCMRTKMMGWKVPFEVGVEVGSCWGLTFPFKVINDTLTLVPDYQLVQNKSSQQAFVIEPEEAVPVEYLDDVEAFWADI